MSVEDEKLGPQLSAYLDGELGDKEARRLEQALESDPQLARQLESLRQMRQAVQALPREPAPAGMAQRVLARAERNMLLSESPPSAGRGQTRWVGRLAAAAVVLLAVGVGIVVVHDLSQPESPDITRRPGTSQPDGDGGLALARGGAPDHGGGMVPETPVMNFYINAKISDLPQVQTGVQRVLENTGIQDVLASPEPPAPARDIRRRGGFYNQRQTGPEQVSFEVPITRRQLRKILNEVNEIREQQNVAQIPLEEEVYANLDVPAGRGLAMADGMRPKAAARAASGYSRELAEGQGVNGTGGIPAERDKDHKKQVENLAAGEPTWVGDAVVEGVPPATGPAAPAVATGTSAPPQAGFAGSLTQPAPAVATGTAATEQMGLAGGQMQIADAAVPSRLLRDELATMPASQPAAEEHERRRALAAADIIQLRIIVNGVVVVRPRPEATTRAAQGE